MSEGDPFYPPAPAGIPANLTQPGWAFNEVRKDRRISVPASWPKAYPHPVDDLIFRKGRTRE